MISSEAFLQDTMGPAHAAVVSSGVESVWRRALSLALLPPSRPLRTSAIGAVAMASLIALAALPPESAWSPDAAAYDLLLRATGGLLFLLMGATVVGATASDQERVERHDPDTRCPRDKDAPALPPGCGAPAAVHATTPQRRVQGVLATAVARNAALATGSGGEDEPAIEKLHIRQPHVAADPGAKGGRLRVGRATDDRPTDTAGTASGRCYPTIVRRHPISSRVAARLEQENRNLRATNSDLSRRNRELFEEFLAATRGLPPVGKGGRG